MRARPLGRTGLSIPTVIHGAWAIGGTWWGGTRDAQAVEALRAAAEIAPCAIDTAPIYGFGHSERIVGQALRGLRERVFLMTKVGMVWDDPRGEFAFEGPGPDGRSLRVYKNLRADSIAREIDASLQRLGTDCIDLVQCHWPDSTTPIAETMGALLAAKRAGKLRAIGVSNFPPALMDEARAALGDEPLASDQPKYNLLMREAERELLPYCLRHGIATVVYSPLEQGLLSGKVPAQREFPGGDQRQGRATFRDANRAAVNAVLERVVRPIAERRRATLAQTCLAWLLAQPGVTSVIAGARTVEQVRENAAASELELAPAELAEIRAAFEALRLELPAKKS